MYSQWVSFKIPFQNTGWVSVLLFTCNYTSPYPVKTELFGCVWVLFGWLGWVCVFCLFCMCIVGVVVVVVWFVCVFKGNVILVFFFSKSKARLQIPEFILHLTQSPFLNVELFTARQQYAPFPLPSVMPDVVKLHFSTVN